MFEDTGKNVCLRGPAVSVQVRLDAAGDTGKAFFLKVWFLNHYLNSEYFALLQTAVKAIRCGRRFILHLLKDLVQLPCIIQI